MVAHVVYHISGVNKGAVAKEFAQFGSIQSGDLAGILLCFFKAILQAIEQKSEQADAPSALDDPVTNNCYRCSQPHFLSPVDGGNAGTDSAEHL